MDTKFQLLHSRCINVKLFSQYDEIWTKLYSLKNAYDKLYLNKKVKCFLLTKNSVFHYSFLHCHQLENGRPSYDHVTLCAMAAHMIITSQTDSLTTNSIDFKFLSFFAIIFNFFGNNINFFGTELIFFSTKLVVLVSKLDLFGTILLFFATKLSFWPLN